MQYRIKGPRVAAKFSLGVSKVPITGLAPWDIDILETPDHSNIVPVAAGITRN